MPRLTDPATIRAILETDRSWSVYALGDLEPDFFEHCRWYGTSSGEPALVLLYAKFEPPVLFTLGAPDVVHTLLGEIAGVRKLYLHIRTDLLPSIKASFPLCTEQFMWRMVLDRSRFHSQPSDDVVRLGVGDVPALQRLYADGDLSGEAPDFFYPSMVEQGVFFAIRAGAELIAAGGTHLVSDAESVGAVGNIYTRRDQRRRGLGARITSAVTAELLRRGLRTIALNVTQRNATAIGVYEGLGYVRYCAFVEGIASRSG
jgi:ribosomal protein S18 acetylase RimI-like enzyme